MSSPFQLNWGILSTGAISGRFAKDLLIDPAPRKAQDVSHRIVAVASRNDSGDGVKKAQGFIDTHLHDAPYKADIKPLPTYEDLYKDPDVQVIYIGTPHSHHYRNCKDSLNAGKHVLLEKSCTVNAPQMEELVSIARSKKLFLMEAVWTRFFPIVYEIQDLIQSDAIGTIRAVEAEFCNPYNLETTSSDHRMIAHSLAGGSILDQGPYAWTWLTLCLQHPLPKGSQQKELSLPKVLSNQVFSNAELSKTLGGQIDMTTHATWKWRAPNGKGDDEAIAVFKTSLATKTPPERCVLISGSKGFIQVPYPPFRPDTFVLKQWNDADRFKANREPDNEKRVEMNFPGDLFGLVWEADEVARCIRDKKLESERMPLNESIQMMKVFDLIRKDSGHKYIDEIEKLDA